MNQREKIQYKTGRCNIPGGSEISTTSTTEIHKREEWHKQYKIFEKQKERIYPQKYLWIGTEKNSQYPQENIYKIMEPYLKNIHMNILYGPSDGVSNKG